MGAFEWVKRRYTAIAIVSGLAGQFFLALFVLPALLAAMGVGRGEGAVGPAGPRASEGAAAEQEND